MIEFVIKAKNMREAVMSELNDIPRGDVKQNLLRQFYWSLRMWSLGSKASTKKSKDEVFMESVKAVRKTHPEFKPLCNGEFQKIKV